MNFFFFWFLGWYTHHPRSLHSTDRLLSCRDQVFFRAKYRLASPPLLPSFGVYQCLGGLVWFLQARCHFTGAARCCTNSSFFHD